MLSQNIIEQILGLEKNTLVDPQQMAKSLTITFFPYQQSGLSKEILDFSEKLKTTLLELGINIVPFENTLVKTPLKKAMKRNFYALFNSTARQIKRGKKVRSGVSIITLGEGQTRNLAMDNITSFRNSNIITIVDMPKEIDKNSDFNKHFDVAMNLFAHHMTNIIIAVDKEKWMIYNFNASHPIYNFNQNFKNQILQALIPKIAAPIRPCKLSEFTVRQQAFDPNDAKHKPIISDLIDNGPLLEQTGLYPPGKTIDELPFRNDFYKWVGKLLLDNRNGMSYGFLARQMPTDLSKQIPEVWIMTLRSGANKTRPDPQKDLIKLGLVNGKMILETPIGLKLKSDYKPSFDTKVILAHAVGNAIIGSRLEQLSPRNNFSKNLRKNGMSLAHWHGYINKNFIPKGWHVYGEKNPHVACSTSQSAIFALQGKLEMFRKCLDKKHEYLGDIHIEPHHGTNITFTNLKDLAEFLNKNPKTASLGNYYLNYY